MSVFYERFERHDQGAGAEGAAPPTTAPAAATASSTATSPTRSRSSASRTGPSRSRRSAAAVFLYYYLDVGNTSQAAHGRASAVALGHKLANPRGVVVALPGRRRPRLHRPPRDHAGGPARRCPITVIFVNNAVYGMTGGQLAPTTLMGQKTTTTPARARPARWAHPLKMAEIIASLDGAGLRRARRALRREAAHARGEGHREGARARRRRNAGFAFVEVLAECPTHLKADARGGGALGDGADAPGVPARREEGRRGRSWAAAAARPTFDPAALLAAIGADAARAAALRERLPADRASATTSALKVAGAGGDGAQTAAMLLARAAINEGFDATHIPSYGPESRGGTSYADVRLAEQRGALAGRAASPHVLVAFNAPSLAKFGPTVAPGGVVVYDGSVVRDAAVARRVGAGRRGARAPTIARELGQPLVKNVVALGALAGGDRAPPRGVAPRRDARRRSAASGRLVEVNEEAFRRGVAAAARRVRRARRATPSHGGADGRHMWALRARGGARGVC